MKMSTERFAAVMRATTMYRDSMREVAATYEAAGDIEHASLAFEQARLVEGGMAVLCHRFPMQVKQAGLSSWLTSGLGEGGENDANEGG